MPGKTTVEAVAADPDDNIVLGCALEGRADYIVTGDHHLRAMKTYRKMPILSPAAFLELWTGTL